MIRALIFDCFGVFYPDPSLAFMREAQTPPDQIKAILSLGEQADLGDLSKADFVKEAAIILRQPADLIEQRFFHSHDRNQQLIDFAQAARQKYKVTLLSNIGGDMMDGFFTPHERKIFFDEVILSGNVKLAKPDAQIFKLACQRLGVDLTESVMIDDLEGNINAAKALGMKGICYQDFEQFKSELNSILTNYS